jgi:hypothetical protein
MEYRRYYLSRRHISVNSNLLTIEEAARRCGIQPSLLEKMLELGIIEPDVSSPDPLFAPEAVPLVCKVLRLHNDLGINWAGLGLVMDLLERIEELEGEIERLRAHIESYME